MDPISKNESLNPDWLPYWQPNNDTSQCSSINCNTLFTILTRRHHCRKCGKIYCNNCWGKLLYVDTYGKKVPVCNSCYIYPT